MGVAVEVMRTAGLRIPLGYVFRGGGPRAVQFARLVLPGGATLDAPCLAYAVRHPDAGVLLIDTGMHPDVATDLRKDFGTAMSVMFRGIKPVAEPWEQQLQSLGVDPAEPLRVVMTHLHVDHTSGMRLLPRATFVCTSQEWAAATAPRAGGKGYVAHHLPPESRMRLVDIERAGEPYGPFASTIDLLGDGTVRLVSTPGHTAGHMSVLLDTEDGELLVVGDAAYTTRSIREGTLPLLTDDDRRYADSLRQLRAWVDEHPDANVTPSHDPEAWRCLSTTTART